MLVVVSLGVCLMVDDSGWVFLEMYLFDFKGDCYGKLVWVEFFKKLCDEEKYVDLFMLIMVIVCDVDNVCVWFCENVGFVVLVID